MVRRRFGETCGLSELGQRCVARGEAPQHRDTALVAEGATQEERTTVEPSLFRNRVADDPRPLVLAKQEPRSRREVRHERDPAELGLRLVAVATGGDLD